MNIWTANSQYEVTGDRKSGFTLKKTGGRINPPSNPAVGAAFLGDEFIAEKGSPAVLKKAGHVVITTSTVTAIFK